MRRLNHRGAPGAQKQAERGPQEPSKFVRSLKSSVNEARCQQEIVSPHSPTGWKKIPVPFLGKQRLLIHRDHILNDLEDAESNSQRTPFMEFLEQENSINRGNSANGFVVLSRKDFYQMVNELRNAQLQLTLDAGRLTPDQQGNERREEVLPLEDKQKDEHQSFGNEYREHAQAFTSNIIKVVEEKNSPMPADASDQRDALDPYIKMKQLGYTEVAICKQMKLNGVPSQDAFALLTALADVDEANPDTVTEDNKLSLSVDLEPYRKMRKIGLPEAAIRHKMTRDGISLKDIDQFVSSVLKDAPEPSLPPSNALPHVDLEPYRNMKKIGLPEAAIRHKMLHDGLSGEDIEHFVQSVFSTKPQPSSPDRTSSGGTELQKPCIQSSLQGMLQERASMLNQVEMKSNESAEPTSEDIERENEKRKIACDSMEQELRREDITVFDEQEFVLHESLGEGRFATVYRAHWKEQNCDVAVKQFRYCAGHPPIGVTRNFRLEATCACRLANSTENDDGKSCIVQLLGVCIKPTLSLVLELGAGGSLHDKIYSTLENGQTKTEAVGFRFIDKISICTDVAKALRFLHGMGYVHRDLKSHNVLLFTGNENGIRAKLCDLGTVVKKPEESRYLQEALGTTGWTAPEVFLGRYNEQADIFSFAILMWEIFVGHRGKNQFAGMSTDEFLRQYESGTRLEIPNDIIQRTMEWEENQTSMEQVQASTCYQEAIMDFIRLIHSCWDSDDDKRPSSAVTVMRLENIAVKLSALLLKQNAGHAKM